MDYEHPDYYKESEIKNMDDSTAAPEDDPNLYPTDGSPFTDTELELSARSGMPPGEVRELMEKDRLLRGIDVLQALIERTMRERKLMGYIIAENELNEREAHSFATIIHEAERMAMMGFGPVSLVTMFQLGVEFAGKDVPDYTEADHEKWVEKIAVNLKTYDGSEPPFLTEPVEVSPHTEVEMTPAERAMLDEDLPQAG
jgi:hypothetical protein